MASDRTRVIGLTGGIASGKSTVAAMLRELGARVIDADAIAREVVEPGQPALAEIAAAFGPEVLGPDGRLDRKRLGAIAFADPDRRRALNAITHPRIAAEAARRLDAARAEGAPAVVYEAALIVENGLHLGMDGLIVVAAPPEVQRARLMARDALDEEAVGQRLAAQAALEAKLAVADWIIDNTGPVEQTRAQVEAAWRDILAGGPRRKQ